MSLNQTKNKTVHPNKLVTKHEEFIVNKGLATRVARVKSTLPKTNKQYEKKLQDRKRKEIQRCSTGLPPTIDQYKKSIDHQYQSMSSKNIRKKFIDNDLVQMGEGEYFQSPMSQNKQSNDFQRKTYGERIYGSPISFANSQTKRTAFSQYEGSPKNRDSFNFARNSNFEQKFKKEQELGMLRGQLIEKNVEMELLKEELKDWWHFDFKSENGNSQEAQQKGILQKQKMINDILNENTTNISKTKSISQQYQNGNYLKKSYNQNDSGFSDAQKKQQYSMFNKKNSIHSCEPSTTTDYGYNNQSLPDQKQQQFIQPSFKLTLNKPSLSESKNPQNLPKIHLKNMKQNNSRNAQKLEPILKNGQTYSSQALNAQILETALQNPMSIQEHERPSTVNMPKNQNNHENNEKFRLRFSSHLDALPKKSNLRYSIQNEEEYLDQIQENEKEDKYNAESDYMNSNNNLEEKTTDSKQPIEENIEQSSLQNPVSEYDLTEGQNDSTKQDNLSHTLPKDSLTSIASSNKFEMSPQIEITTKTLASRGNTANKRYRPFDDLTDEQMMSLYSQNFSNATSSTNPFKQEMIMTISEQ